VLAALSQRLGSDTGILTGSMATQRMAEHVPFYAGITLDELGGRGVRWQEREAAAAYTGAADAGPFGLELPPARRRASDAQRLDLFEGSTAMVTPEGGDAVEAIVAVRSAVPEGSAFLEGEVAGIATTAGIRKAETAVLA
jgi:NADH-quinone oxidoreductase subunit G